MTLSYYFHFATHAIEPFTPLFSLLRPFFIIAAAITMPCHAPLFRCHYFFAAIAMPAILRHFRAIFTLLFSH
jgi:hypothetical protein